MIGKKLKLVLLGCLLGALMLIFFFQKRYFAEELNDPWLGGYFLGAILFFEFLSHFALFKSKKLFAKVLFGSTSFTILIFSVFVNFAVQVHLSEESHSNTIEHRTAEDRQLSLYHLRLDLLEQQKKRLGLSITENRQSIQGYRKSRPWLTLKYIKANEAHLRELKRIDMEILSESNKRPLTKESYSILERLESSTGLPAGLISLMNKGFFALLLAFIPMGIVWFLCLESDPTAPPKREDEEDNDQQDEDEEGDLVPAASRGFESQSLLNTFSINKTRSPLLSFNTFTF